MIKSKTIGKTILNISDYLLGSLVDYALWNIAFLGSMSIPQSTNGQIWQANKEANKILEEFNYTDIKNAIKRAKLSGFVSKPSIHTLPEITEEGKRRLYSLLPQYDEHRVWDKRMHIITYDVPEKKRYERELLREYLTKIRCARLQDSVWMTPYNPVDLIREFVRFKNLTGTVIVSDLGEKGSIGDETLSELIIRVYKLKELNKRYLNWLENKFSNGHSQLLNYLSILKDDPQLPFTLLPTWWKGDRAYNKIKIHYNNVLFKLRPSL